MMAENYRASTENSTKKSGILEFFEFLTVALAWIGLECVAMNPAQGPYWFRAKRYGYGWGWPATWQGWLVTIVWLLGVAAGIPLAIFSLPLFILWMILLVAGILAVCFAKGEPPKWR
jgi:hypothetical protein